MIKKKQILPECIKDELRENARILNTPKPKNDFIILIASSPDWEKDYYKFTYHYPDIKYDIFAINGALTFLEDVKHWGSLHPRCFKDAKWDDIRVDKGWHNSWKGHGPNSPSSKYKPENRWNLFIDCIWDVVLLRGSSSLFCVGVSYALGYKRAILCGCTLYNDYRRYQRGWYEFKRVFPDYLRAFSGAPNTICGKVTKDWVYSDLD